MVEVWVTMGWYVRAVALELLCCTWLAGYPAQAADPNALWRVVHNLCVTDMVVSGLPAPCTTVDLKRGYALLNDIRGATQILLVPTRRMNGIESPELLSPTSPNYWQYAWDTLPLLEKRAGRPVRREDVGLAINSVYSRTQNQLHIHIDCVRADVRRILQQDEHEIGFRWSRLNISLAGHYYKVRRLEGAALGSRDPFKLLASGDAKARADMGGETLVLIGASFGRGAPGFFLLSDRADFDNNDVAAGEDLLDHRCAVLGGA
jgi:CDP-diacylglycerol pyrophosphatase